MTMTLGEHHTMAASASMFYIAIDYKNKIVAANKKLIKIHQLFSKQRILGIRVTIVQRKISGDVVRTCS